MRPPKFGNTKNYYLDNDFSNDFPKLLFKSLICSFPRSRSLSSSYYQTLRKLQDQKEEILKQVAKD